MEYENNSLSPGYIAQYAEFTARSLGHYLESDDQVARSLKEEQLYHFREAVRIKLHVDKVRDKLQGKIKQITDA